MSRGFEETEDTRQPLSILLNYLSYQSGDVSINKIASDLAMNRNSVGKYLTILHMLGQVEHRSFGKLKLFRLSMRVPFSAIKNIWSGLVLGLDRQYDIKDISGEVRSFFEIEPEAIIGAHFRSLPYPLFSSREFTNIITQCVEGKRNEQYQTEFSRNGMHHIIKIIPCVFDDGGTGAAIAFSDESDRLTVREELERWKEIYYTLVEKSSDMVIIFSPDKKIIHANEMFLRYYNTALKDIRKTRKYQQILSNVSDKEKSNGFLPETPFKESTTEDTLQDGSPRWQRWGINAIFREDELIEYLVIGSDITYQKSLHDPLFSTESGSEEMPNSFKTISDLEKKLSIETELRRRLSELLTEKEQEFHSFLQSTSDYVWQINQSDKIVSCSADLADLLGYPPDEIIGRRVYDFLTTDAILEFRLMLSHSKKPDYRISWMETSLFTRDGRSIPLLFSGVPIRDTRGSYLGFQGIGRDISKDLIIEEKERRLTDLLETVTEGVAIQDDNGDVLYVNSSARRLLAIPDDIDLHAYNYRSFLNPRSHKAMKYAILSSIEKGIWRGTVIFHSFTGEEIPVFLIITSRISSHTKKRYFSIIARDIREKIFYEREISDHNSYSRSLLESIRNPVIICTIEGMIRDMNNAVEILTGYQKEKLIGTDISHFLYDPSTKEKFQIQDSIKHPKEDYSLEIICADGRSTMVRITTNTYQDQMGNIRGVIGTFRKPPDVQERSQ